MRITQQPNTAATYIRKWQFTHDYRLIRILGLDRDDALDGMGGRNDHAKKLPPLYTQKMIRKLHVKRLVVLKQAALNVARRKLHFYTLMQTDKRNLVAQQYLSVLWRKWPYVQPYAMLADANQRGHNEILDAPVKQGSVRALTRQLRNDIQFSAGYYYQETLKILNTAPQSRMHRLDLRIAKTFDRKEKVGGGEIALVLQNALQDGYTGYSAVPQTNNIILFNRRVYLAATFNF